MSTKRTLKHGDDKDSGVGFHLYRECFDEDKFVYLELEGVVFEAATSIDLSGSSPARVAVRIPDAVAGQLGLTGPDYEEVRAQALAGDIEPDQAVAELNKLRAREAGRRLIALGGTMPDLERIPRRRDIAKSLHDRKAEDPAERSTAMDVIHPPADILERILKGDANLRGLDYWERYTFLNWLYLAYTEASDGQLQATVEGHLEILRIIAAADHVFGAWGKARDWLKQPNAELGEARPIDLLATADGGPRVESLITRMAERLSLEERRAIGAAAMAAVNQEPGTAEIIEEIQARIAARRVFGDKAEQWLNLPLARLGGRLPGEMIQNAESRRAVLEILVQIEEGMFT